MELGNQLLVAAPGEDFHRAFEGALVHARKRLGHTHRLLVKGRFLKSNAGTFQTALPADTRMLCGRFQKATRQQVRQAVATAQEAGHYWREFGWQQRVAYLRKAAELMTDHRHELAALICLEVGKSRCDAFAEVTEAIQAVLYYCQQTERHQGFAYRMNGSNEELKYVSPFVRSGILQKKGGMLRSKSYSLTADGVRFLKQTTSGSITELSKRIAGF